MNNVETARLIEIARMAATGDDLAFVESIIRKRAADFIRNFIEEG